MFSIQRIASFLIIITLSVFIIDKLQFILVPLTFAVLLTLMVLPISAFVERFLKWRGLAILITFVIILIPVAAIMGFFSIQLVNIFEQMPNIAAKIKDGVNEIFDWVNQQWGFSKAESQVWLGNNISKIIDAPITFFKKGISSSTTVIFNVFLALISLFFLLWYRSGIQNFILMQFKADKKDEIKGLIRDIKTTVQHYLYGLSLVILILAVLNSTGLWLIGIKYAILWGSLAALLAIIPYVGTTLGGILPFIYSIATADYWWQPLAVVLLYVGIQNIEGYFITPNVVGSGIKINPFVAILSIILGGTLWGISGVILALPLVAIIKLIFDHIDMLKPVGLLMSDGLHENPDDFLNKYDSDQYRLTNMFKRKAK